MVPMEVIAFMVFLMRLTVVEVAGLERSAIGGEITLREARVTVHHAVNSAGARAGTFGTPLDGNLISYPLMSA